MGCKYWKHKIDFMIIMPLVLSKQFEHLTASLCAWQSGAGSANHWCRDQRAGENHMSRGLWNNHMGEAVGDHRRGLMVGCFRLPDRTHLHHKYDAVSPWPVAGGRRRLSGEAAKSAGGFNWNGEDEQEPLDLALSRWICCGRWMLT